MEIEQELKKLYRSKFFTIYASSAIIEESELGSVLKEVSLSNNGEFLLIDKGLLDGMKSAYAQKEENPLFDINHVCDGIVVLEKSENDRFIFFIELKSAYTTTNMLKAKKQIEACVVKFSAMLHPFKKIDIKKYRVAGIAVSLPLNMETKDKLIKRAKQDADRDCRFSSSYFCLNLSEKGCLVLSSNQQEKDSLPFADEIYFDKFPLFHVGYDGTPIDLDHLCKQLSTLF